MEDGEVLVIGRNVLCLAVVPNTVDTVNATTLSQSMEETIVQLMVQQMWKLKNVTKIHVPVCKYDA